MRFVTSLVSRLVKRQMEMESDPPPMGINPIRSLRNTTKMRILSELPCAIYIAFIVPEFKIHEFPVIVDDSTICSRRNRRDDSINIFGTVHFAFYNLARFKLEVKRGKRLCAMVAFYFLIIRLPAIIRKFRIASRPIGNRQDTRRVIELDSASIYWPYVLESLGMFAPQVCNKSHVAW